MRVAVDCLSASTFAGGIGSMTMNLLRTWRENEDLLSKYDVTIDLLYPHGESIGTYHGGSTKRMVCSFRKRLLCSREDWEDYYVANLVRKMGADLLYSPSFRTPAAVEIPTVVTTHDVIFEPHTGWADPPSDQGLEHRKRARDSAVRARWVCVPSSHARDDIISAWKLNPAKVKVIPNAPSPIFFNPPPRQAAQSTLRYLYGVSPPFILYYGGLGVRKAVPLLLEVFARIARDYPSLTLVLLGAAGNATVAEELRRLCLERHRVVCLPFVPELELPFFLSAAEMLVYPSNYEGFGLPPLEAMAAGTPVIVSETTSMPEVCRDGAAYFAAGDPISLTRTILALLGSDDLRASLRARGTARAQRFSWLETAAEYLKTFREALD